MDLKTKLNDESIFYKKSQPTKTINYLNASDIYTIDDFINSDVEKITSTPDTRKIYRAMIGILAAMVLMLALLNVRENRQENAKTEGSFLQELLQALLTLKK